MTERPRLVLHIGTHKTGTTTLQDLMFKQREALAGQGFLYGRTDRQPSPHDRKHAFLGNVMKTGGPELAALLGELRAELAESGCGTLVMSAEGLSAPGWLPNTKVLVALRDAFDVTIVCFLRRPDFFAESFWNHRCKAGLETDDIATFIARGRMKRHMRYPRMLRAWTGIGDVKVGAFEAVRKTGLVEAFAQLSGVPLTPDPSALNVSPSMPTAACLAVLNRLELSYKWPRVEKVIQDKTRVALGSRLRTSILQSNEEVFRKLANGFGVSFPDDMPDEPEDPMPLPSEDVARRIWSEAGSGLARAIGRALS